MQKIFWVNKRVLVTGAGGFIGTHLVEYLRARGARVIGTERKKLDVTNYVSLAKLFSAHTFDICYHLAADSLVESGQEHPYKTLKNNFLSALNVLELCRLKNVRRIIIASTVHVYGDGNGLLLEENPPRPSRPYETSKTCVDLISQSYADTFHLPVLIPRFVNIYGPGDLNFARVIPKTIKSILRKRNPSLWGGSAVREYLYIEDALRAFDLLAQMSDEQIEKNRIYNFGSGESISVVDLMEKVIILANSKNKIERVRNGRIDEIKAQKVSWNKAKRVFGWEPRIDLNTGLQMTIDWYRRHYDFTY